MALQVMRRVGAMAILVMGAVHLQQYLGDYQFIPTIGPLFGLNAIGSAVVALGLMLPLERWLRERRGEIAVGLLALGGGLIALGALVSLYIAETGTLFGFSEGTLDPVMWVAIVSEAAAVVLLAPLAVANLVGIGALLELRGRDYVGLAPKVPEPGIPGGKRMHNLTFHQRHRRP